MGGGCSSGGCSRLTGPRVLQPYVRLPPRHLGPSSRHSRCRPCTCTCSVTCRVGIPPPGTYVCPCVCAYVCVHACMYACMHACVCMHVCVYVCMYACMYAALTAAAIDVLLMCFSVPALAPSGSDDGCRGAAAAISASLTAATVIFVVGDATVAFMPLAIEVAAGQSETTDFMSRFLVSEARAECGVRARFARSCVQAAECSFVVVPSRCALVVMCFFGVLDLPAFDLT